MVTVRLHRLSHGKRLKNEAVFFSLTKRQIIPNLLPFSVIDSMPAVCYLVDIFQTHITHPFKEKVIFYNE